jgi:hypothetical protein
MIAEHLTTLGMLNGINSFVEGVGDELMADFQDLPNFYEKIHRIELVAELKLFSRMMLLERCERLPAGMRTDDVEARIAQQRAIVKSAEVQRMQRETAFGNQGLPDTLRSIGWTAAPDKWGPAPREMIDDAARPFIYRFEDYDIIASVAELWEEGVTPADVPEEYRDAMRKEGYLPPFNEDCDVRCEWVAFLSEGNTGATDAAKWLRVFGTVPRWDA